MLTDPTGGSTNPFDPNCGGSPTLNLDRPLEDFNISIPEGLDRPVITASRIRGKGSSGIVDAFSKIPDIMGVVRREIYNSDIGLKILPDAISFDIALHTYAVNGLPVKPVGVLIPLRGPDAFKGFLFSEVATGGGFDMSLEVNFNVHKVIIDDVSKITAQTFAGPRAEVNFGAKALGSVGLSGSASLPNFDGSYVPVLSGSVSLGVAVPTPFGVSGNANVGWTIIQGRIF